MKISKKILWLENDVGFHRVYADYFRMKGHEVRLTARVSEAESLLGSGAYDLLILDVMIPTWDENEERDYPPDQTDRGHATGLVFYRRMQKNPGLRGLPVLVFTIRRDTQLFEAFKQEGLPDDCFATKFEYRDPEALFQKVEEIAGAA